MILQDLSTIEWGLRLETVVANSLSLDNSWNTKGLRGLIHYTNRELSVGLDLCYLTWIIWLDDTDLALLDVDDLLLDSGLSISLRGLLVLQWGLKRWVQLHIGDQEHDKLSIILSKNLVYFFTHGSGDFLSFGKEVVVSEVLGDFLNGIL